jgi:hypothetical protein
MYIRNSVTLLTAMLAFAVSLAAAAQGSAPPAGSAVTAVMSPAWLVHGSATTPIKPGMQIGDGDTLRTGAGGRVYIDLPEHSRVKLGENTEFATPSMIMTQDNQGSMFKAALHILKGVFRFTTSLVGKSERRHVDIQVGVATIGIRGTDVWGRAGTDGSLVALLEGKAEMSMPGQAAPMAMDQPMHYMMMPAQGQMQMNVPVSQQNMSDWSAQTDVQQGGGVLSSDGQWTVALVSSSSDADAMRLMKKLADAGYPSEDTMVTVKGKPYHRLVIRQAASLQDARALGTLVNKQFPLMSPWAFKTKN